MSREFQTPIQLPDGTIVGRDVDLGIVHVGPDAPTGAQPGTTWVDTDDVAGPYMGVPVEVQVGGPFPNLTLSGATQLLVGSISFDPPDTGGMLAINTTAYADIPNGTMSIATTFLRVSLDGGATSDTYAVTSGGMDRPSGARVQRESLSSHTAVDVSGATGKIIVELWAYQTSAVGGNATLLNGGIVGTLYSGAPVILDNRYAKLERPRMLIRTDPTSTRNLHNSAHADWNTVYYDHSDWSPVGISALTANFNGMGWFTANLELTSVIARVNLRVLIEKNGTGSGPYLPGAGASGYIRAYSGHEESSIYIRAFDPAITVGDEYRVRTVSYAAVGDIFAIPEGSYFCAERVF